MSPGTEFLQHLQHALAITLLQSGVDIAAATAGETASDPRSDNQQHYRDQQTDRQWHAIFQHWSSLALCLEPELMLIA